MEIRSAKFEISSAALSQCPPDKFPEIAFIGRSNVGKSSLINMLTGHNKLAKTSSTPGKTQLINHFIINDNWYIVDLPGYGYAQVAKTQREKFRKMIDDYLLKRKSLYCVFVLVDSRLKPQKIDIDFINFLGENEVPFEVIFTKTDKQSKKKTDDNTEQFRQALSQTWEEMPKMMLSSSETKAGKDEILNEIENIIKQ
ncbi:MAG: YihA family ribosome biogenesis GTP-binding protein [Bacteroidales bacterium]|nr:YihA family ribosome biogenesis GTP-binding protein [Bacteroidales bacterium]MBQ7985556.1 YihA family ribosome biogenesis GTP-binding protein [Bacteroidales bacterium]